MIPTGFLSMVGLMMGKLEGRMVQALRRGVRCCCFCLVTGAECGPRELSKEEARGSGSGTSETWESEAVLPVWWSGSVDKSQGIGWQVVAGL